MRKYFHSLAMLCFVLISINALGQDAGKASNRTAVGTAQNNGRDLPAAINALNNAPKSCISSSNAGGAADAQSLISEISAQINNTGKAKLDLFVMSQCPFGVMAEETLIGVMQDYSADQLEFNLYFIAGEQTVNNKKVFNSLHGQPEIDENIRQIIIARQFPGKFLAYLKARSANYQNTNWQTAATAAGIDVQAISIAAATRSAQELFSQNIKKAQSLNINGSPTLLINGQRFTGRLIAMENNFASACQTGTDPFSGKVYTVCTATPTYAWISATNGGGQYHSLYICNSLGYAAVGRVGGTCGSVCGYCTSGTSCSSPQANTTFDGSGTSCGADANGPILCNTVQWECVGTLATCSNPTAFSVTGGGTSCSGSGVLIGLSDSELGVDYQLKLNGVNSGTVVAGTGNAISFGTRNAAGNYTVQATNATSSTCTSTMTGSATISAGTAPSFANTNVYLEGFTNQNSCSTNFTYPLSVSGTSPTVTYQLTGATTASGSGTGSGANFNKGITHVVVTASNACGTVSTAFDVTITDRVFPEARCKPTVVFLDANGMGSISPSDLDDGSSDNCGPVTFSVNTSGTICGTAPENGTVFLQAPPGTVIDQIIFASYGTPNGSCGSFMLGGCHASNSVTRVGSVALGHNSASIPATNGFFGDPCGGTVKRLYIEAHYSGAGPSGTNFTCADIGQNTVAFHVTDGSGNVSTCNATVTVVDQILPHWTTAEGSLNTTIECGDAQALADARALAPVAEDNCTASGDIVYVTNYGGFVQSGSCPQGGTYTNTFTASDASNNTIYFQQVITVVDTQAPVLTGSLPAGGSGLNLCYANRPAGPSEADIASQYTDHCGNVHVTKSASPSGNNCNWSVTYHYMITDDCNNSTTADITYSGGDTEAPHATGTLPTGATGMNVCYSNVPAGPSANDIAALYADNCGNVHVVRTGTPTGTDAGWSVTYHYEISDDCHRTTSYDITYSGADAEAPVINCTDNITTNNNNGVCGAVVNYPMPTATDNCGGATITGYTISNTAHNPFDMSGATNLGGCDDCQFGPVPLPFSFNYYGTDFNQVYVYPSTNGFISFEPTNNGCCSGQSLPNAGYPNTIFAAWSDWVTGINYKIFGSAPNRVAVFSIAGGAYSGGGSLNSQIALYEGSNNVQIILTNVSNTTYYRTEGLNKNGSTATPVPERNATYGWTTSNESKLFTPTTFGGSGPVAVTQTAGLPSGSVFPVGTTTNTFSATDGAGHTSTCSFTVTVNDTEAPVITCPADITVNNDAGQCGAKVCYSYPTVTENCGRPATPAGYHFLTSVGNHYYYQSNAQSNYTVAQNNAEAAGGHLAVITSAAENTAIASAGGGFAWIGGNDLGSEGTFHWSDCEPFGYANFCGGEPNGGTFENHLEFESGGCWNDLFAGANRFSIMEIEGAKLVRTAGPASNGAFPVGTTTVSYTATDAAGNSSSCSFTVTVNDTELPVLHNVPGDVTVQCDQAPAAANVTATDNCPDVSTVRFEETRTDGSCPNSYTLTRVWTAIDAHNNTQTATQVITVIDNSAPTFTAPANITLYKDANCNVDASPSGAAGDVTNEHDNCATGLNATYNDVIANNCEGTYTITRTWSLVDLCGNAAANQTQTITVRDNTAPTFTRPADITLYKDANCNVNSSPTGAAGDVTNEHDNCSTGLNATYSDAIANNCEGTYTITRTWSLVDNCGNAAASQTQTITVRDNTAPTFTRPADITLYKDANCNVNSSPTGAAGDVTNEHDNCSTGLNATYSDVVVNNCQGTYTITRTWSLVDNCGNAAANQTQTITVRDNTAPTFTRPADVTILYTSSCGYNASLVNTGDVTNEADNCSTGLQATYTDDAVTQCGYNTVITRTWHLVDNCGNAAANQVQTITVTDNNTNYIIYATNEAKFGENNTINGDVGVTAANGKAEFKKYDVLDPYHVYAKNINTQSPSSVNNKHFVPATGGPNPPFYLYGGSGLSGNYTQSVSGVVPAGNYKELKIKNGVTVTVNGSNYGKITIEEGADVTFTSNSIDMEELSVGKGKKNVNTTNVHFMNCTAVRIKDKVTIEEDCRINVDGPKVNFYMADNKKDEEKFTVKGDNTWVTLNIMIPNGKLKVNGGNVNGIMTGWFIVEKLESDGKFVTWNPYGCTIPAARTSIPVAVKAAEATPKTAFEVTAYPNPSRTDFNFAVTGMDQTKPVLVRITDISGRVRMTKTATVAKGGMISLGNELKVGSYFAEISQGNDRKVIKLVKLN